MHICRVVRAVTDTVVVSGSKFMARAGDPVIEKLLFRKLLLDERLISSLAPHLAKFTTKDCLKILSLAKFSSCSTFVGIEPFLKGLNDQLIRNLQFNSPETAALVIVSLARLNQLEILQAVCDNLTCDELLDLSSRDSVNVLNVLTRHKINAPNLIKVLIEKLFAEFDKFDHRLGTLLLASVSRSQVSLSPLHWSAVENWALGQLAGKSCEWTPQSISLFVYSLSKLGWRNESSNPISRLINETLVRSYDEFSVQNFCLTLVGLINTCNLSHVPNVLLGLERISVDKKNLMFLLKHLKANDQVIDFALGKILAISASLSNGDWATVARHFEFSTKTFTNISLPVLFYLIGQTNYRGLITDWSRYTYSVCDAKTGARVLQTIARLERRDVPEEVIHWALNTTNTCSSYAVLSLVSLAVISRGFDIAGLNRLTRLIASVDELNPVDLRQFQRFVAIVDDKTILSMLLEIIPHITISSVPSPPVLSRPSRAQEQVRKTLGTLVLLSEVAVPEIASSIDMVIVQTR